MMKKDVQTNDWEDAAKKRDQTHRCPQQDPGGDGNVENARLGDPNDSTQTFVSSSQYEGPHAL